MSKPFKGVSREQERAAFQLLRDTRRGSEKLLLGLKQPYTNAGLCLALSVLALAAPPLAHFVPPALLLLFLIWLNARREDVLPIRMPVESNCIDYNDPQPGINRGYKKASGIFYLGNDSCKVPQCDNISYSAIPTKEELWARYYTVAPQRQRRCVEQYKIVKRA